MSPGDGPGLTATDRLDSWKEIAAFLGRGVTTVQRWEEEEGLPVHRHVHAKRGTVYASKAELAAWRDRREVMTTLPPPISASPRGSRQRRARLALGVAIVATLWAAVIAHRAAAPSGRM